MLSENSARPAILTLKVLAWISFQDCEQRCRTDSPMTKCSRKFGERQVGIMIFFFHEITIEKLQFLHVLIQFCIVAYPGGWSVILCPHGVVYSIKFNLRAESPRDFADLLLSWKHIPNVSIYDLHEAWPRMAICVYLQLSRFIHTKGDLLSQHQKTSVQQSRAN